VSSQLAHELRRFRTLATALDARWRLPGTSIHFGWDAVIGLLPGVGDGLAGLVGGYGLYAGWRLGAPAAVLVRMLLNLAIETVFGSIPVAGDLFDIGFHGNLRNVGLLERWLAHPGDTTCRSRWLLGGLAVLLLGSALLAVALVLAALRFLLMRA
jgi:hypothetical protein